MIPIGIIVYDFTLLWDSLSVERAVYKLYLSVLKHIEYIDCNCFIFNSRQLILVMYVPVPTSFSTASGHEEFNFFFIYKEWCSFEKLRNKQNIRAQIQT